MIYVCNHYQGTCKESLNMRFAKLQHEVLRNDAGNELLDMNAHADNTLLKYSLTSLKSLVSFLEVF